MTLKQLRSLVDACLREPGLYDGGYPCERQSEKEVCQALTDFLKTNPYPGEDYYRLASEFYHETRKFTEQCGILDRWLRAKGSPSEPIEHYCELANEGAISARKLEEVLAEGLKRAPDDLRLLTVAYDLACEEDNWGRRLFFALELTKHGKSAADSVVYGIECGRNAMPERAEEAFQKALELEPKNSSALNGLAMCAFERVEMGKAEELFRKSLKTDPGDEYAQEMLKKIAAIRKGEPLAKRAEARRKFWKHWQDTELVKLSDEQRRKRMAEVVAGTRKRITPCLTSHT